MFRVEVSDSGVGIAPENHHRVFGEFSQFKRNELQGGGFLFFRDNTIRTAKSYTANSDSGGSGLGLWISKKVIEIHKVKSIQILNYNEIFLD